MKISFLGTRGIPAKYSGFERFVEEVAVRLARAGHEVTVYNRTPFNTYPGGQYQGVRLVRLPTIPTKATDTLIHGLICTLHALAQGGGSVLYYCGVGNAIWAWLARLFGRITVLNVDGADFARAKWSGVGRWWLRQSERWAKGASVVIADNREIQKRYRQEHGIESEFIPYGTRLLTDSPGHEELKRWSLETKKFFLYVSRLTPENGALEVIRAYRRSGSPLPLVLVGDEPYEKKYLGQLRREAAAGGRVIFTGYLFGEGYRQLSWHARAFFLGSAFDATRPVLLEQMGSAGCVVVQDVPGNREVVGEAGWKVDPSDPVAGYARAFQDLSQDLPQALALGRAAQQRVRSLYDWDRVTSQYLELFQNMGKTSNRSFAAGHR